jgi:hypothetical protein
MQYQKIRMPAPTKSERGSNGEVAKKNKRENPSQNKQPTKD